MVWSLITLGTGLALWGILWLVAGMLEQKAANQKQAAGHDSDSDVDDMSNYEKD